MISDMMSADIGPNIGTEAEQFFQSDRDIEIMKRREAKAIVHGKAGEPLKMASKLLDMALVYGASNEAYIAESAFLAKKVSLETGKASKVFRGHTGPVTSLAIVYNSKLEDEFLFTGSWDKNIKKWNVETKECVQTLEGHHDFVKCLVVYGNWLFSGSADKTIRQWNIQTGECIRTFKDHTRGVESIVIDDDGKHFFSASSDTTIKKWNIADGSLVSTLTGHLTSVYFLTIVDGALWSASADKTVKRWDMESEKCDTTLEHADFVKSIAVSGKYVFTGSRDEDIRVWDSNTEKIVRLFEGHLDEVAVLHVRGNWLYSAGLDSTIRKWEITETNIRDPKFKYVPPSAEDAAKPPAPKKKAPAAPKNTSMTEEEERELAELMGDDL